MQKQKVAIQGLRGSFHHEASHHFFGDNIELCECETFPSVMAAVVSGRADVALMAIENSLAGCIIPNYALLRSNPVEVCGEVGLRVKMNLMTLPGTDIEQIAEAHSHQMAIRQCGEFFHKHRHMKVVEAFDTAGSAKNIKDNQLKNIAAIASLQAAKEYDLEVVKAGIEDHSLNYTRFLVICPKGKSNVVNPNKVSVYFQTKNDAGSLANTLTIISGLGINLSKLQSHPVPSKNSLYGFYATLEIQDSSQLDDLNQIMERMTIQFETLGIYRKGETHG
ncbi:prephenate dehydratase domain-containing protein [Ekhidna sp.]|uniref:prephenate dehydratase n=1 Tax=Ekhidna sp. TaxID=2608089 RepID=UPI0032971BFA